MKIQDNTLRSWNNSAQDAVARWSKTLERKLGVVLLGNWLHAISKWRSGVCSWHGWTDGHGWCFMWHRPDSVASRIVDLHVSLRSRKIERREDWSATVTMISLSSTQQQAGSLHDCLMNLHSDMEGRGIFLCSSANNRILFTYFSFVR